MDISQTNYMSANEHSMRFVELVGSILDLQKIDELETTILPELANITGASFICLFLIDPRLSTPCFFQYGQTFHEPTQIQRIYAEEYKRLTTTEQSGPALDLIKFALEQPPGLQSFNLHADYKMLGIVGFVVEDPGFENLLMTFEGFIFIIAKALDRLLERQENQNQLSRLNTYLTISSLLYQSINLHELLEMVLYCCMETVSAEAASVLLLSEDKETFKFYQVEGEAKPLLIAADFPSNSGLAGSILQSGNSEIINNVYQDPRFYQNVDSRTGFSTRNMIVIPLVAGEEKIGILEVINKADDGDFMEEEHMLLVSIGEEIAFAIRNAKIFDYVVNTYCKQRQGLMSCKGCDRPLGSWTPCVKYRESSI